MTRVFISYSQESGPHVRRVQALADALRRDGIASMVDQYEENPKAGWPRWMEEQVRESNFVLLICTETYLRRLNGDEEPGVGCGAIWEGHLIYKMIERAGSANERFVPVLLPGSTPAHIPLPLAGTYYCLEKPELADSGYERLYRRLTGQVPEPPDVGELLHLGANEWPEVLDSEAAIELVERAQRESRRKRVIEFLREVTSTRPDETELFWGYVARGEIGDEDAFAELTNALAVTKGFARKGVERALRRLREEKKKL